MSTYEYNNFETVLNVRNEMQERKTKQCRDLIERFIQLRGLIYQVPTVFSFQDLANITAERVAPHVESELDECYCLHY